MPKPAKIKPDTDYSELENYSNFLKYQPTWVFQKLISLRHKTIAAFTGNRAFKTSGFAYQYVYRIMGWHPIPEKNVLYFECRNNHKFTVLTLPKDWICPNCKSEIKVHERNSRVFRFASENLPGETSNVSVDGTSAEVKNTVYPEFKKWLPPILMRRDIKFRSMSMIVADPNYGNIYCDKEYKGNDIIVEFVSYSQSVQSGAGVTRMSIWMDEEPNYDFYEEQIARLPEEQGDLLLSLTPANKISWTFDEIFEKAHVYVRTQSVCDFLATDDYKPQQIEFTDSPHSIAVIQASTYDNPILSKESIEQMEDQFGDDPDLKATRIYGIHKQAKGRIFKMFEYKTHFIDRDKYFPNGIPYNWVHGRGIDYHPQTPWACGAISLSPQDEAFIWLDYNPSPDKYTTKEICYNYAVMCKEYQFRLNLIDPLSEGIKKDKITVLDDINREFRELKNEGIGLGGYWQTWDTKGEKGRDEIKKRLLNAKKCERPFNNRTTDNRGREIYLPTLWILNNCKTAAQYMRKWRWEEYIESKMIIMRDAKNRPEEKWSHFNMVWEALFKHPSFKSRRISETRKETRKIHYFQGRR